MRRRLGYTQEELAAELNAALNSTYGKAAVSKWETGSVKPPMEVLEVLEELEKMSGARAEYLLRAYGYLDETASGGTSVVEGIPSEFQAGDMKLHLVRVLGGDGKIRYCHPDGIQTIFHNKSFELPQHIGDYYNWLLKRRRSEAKGAAFESRHMVRLDDYEFGLTDPYDEPYPLILHVGLTDYNEMMVTNRSLNTQLPKSRLLLREIYAKDPLDFRGSGLANPLAVNLSLVTTKDWKIYVARRGQKVATNPAGLGPAVSGTANPLDFEGRGKYSPFLTAQRESYEEVTRPYEPEFSEVVFFGLARTLEFYFPFLFGELRLDLSEEDLRSSTPQDNWDVSGLISIPFEIQEVVSFMKKTYRYMVEQQDRGPGTTLFSLYQSLIYQYPERRTEIKEALERL